MMVKNTTMHKMRLFIYFMNPLDLSPFAYLLRNGRLHFIKILHKLTKFKIITLLLFCIIYTICLGV